MKRSHSQNTRTTEFFGYVHYLTNEPFIQTRNEENKRIPVFVDNSPIVNPLMSFAESKAPVSFRLNHMTNGEVCFNNRSEVFAAQPQDVGVSYKEVRNPRKT